MTIAAEAHSDDYHVKVKFDATPWFVQASDDAILELAGCNWGGDYPADDVARFFDRDKPETVGKFPAEPLFEYLATDPTMAKDDPVGFECHIDEDDAMAWLRANRPGLAEKIEAEEDED